MTERIQVPEPPKFTKQQIEECQKSGDFMPILFEWYKFVQNLCIVFALFKKESPAFREIPDVQYSVLTGLLNRCARLMLANMCLSHNGRFGETTAILDRCILESCIKVTWLCHNGTEDAFNRYLADGLKTELELSAEIQKNIAGREGGRMLAIEERMLHSIDRHIALSGLSSDEVVDTRRLPNFAEMLNNIGHQRLMYVIWQRLGSHHVHGTWPSLLFHYIEEEGESLLPRDHDCAPNADQYVAIPLQVLCAMEAYIGFTFASPDDRDPLQSLLASTEEEILKIHSEMAEGDFDAI